MKVRNFAFFGVMASILGISAANAASDTVIASQAYVDAVANTKQNTLNATNVVVDSNHSTGNVITGISAANGVVTYQKGNVDTSGLQAELGSSNVTTTGTGNAVTEVTASDGNITVKKGTTFLTEHQSLDSRVPVDQNGKKDYVMVTNGSGNVEAYQKDDHIVFDDEGKKISIRGFQAPIDNLDAIRSGAQAGATAVQPEDLADVATSGDYNDLINTPAIPRATDLADTAPSATWNSERKELKIVTGEEAGNLATKLATSAQVDTSVSAVKSYTDNELSKKANTGDIPTVNNATLSITQNGVSAGTFTANQGTDGSIAIAAADWNAAAGTAGEIKNKPTLGTAASANTTDFQKFSDSTAEEGEYIVSGNAVGTNLKKLDTALKDVASTANTQADWNQTNTNAVDFIKNKPTVDQNYSATSQNAQSGTAVASAISGISTTATEALQNASVSGTGEAITSATEDSSHNLELKKSLLNYNKAMEYKLANYTTGKTAEQFVASECSAENPCVLTIVGMDSNGQPNYEWTQMAL